MNALSPVNRTVFVSLRGQQHQVDFVCDPFISSNPKHRYAASIYLSGGSVLRGLGRSILHAYKDLLKSVAVFNGQPAYNHHAVMSAIYELPRAVDELPREIQYFATRIMNEALVIHEQAGITQCSKSHLKYLQEKVTRIQRDLRWLSDIIYNASE